MPTAAHVVCVSPGRSNSTYTTSETSTFRITVTLGRYPAAGIAIKYRLSPAIRVAAEIFATVPADRLTLPAATLPAAAFRRAIPTVTSVAHLSADLPPPVSPQRDSAFSVRALPIDAFEPRKIPRSLKFPVNPRPRARTLQSPRRSFPFHSR